MNSPSPDAISPKTLASMIDHTALKPETTPDQIRTLCAEAREYGFASVCINPCHVALAAELLRGSAVAVCTVIGFPLGATTTVIKAAETTDAVRNGASEVDMVINVGALKAGARDQVEQDIAAVVQAAARRARVKVILEACLLTAAEKVLACRAAQAAGADFVKTSTGFAAAGATVADVKLLRATVGADMGVKAAGGIRDYATAVAMVRAGANRLGTSRSVTIVTGEGSTSGGN